MRLKTMRPGSFLRALDSAMTGAAPTALLTMLSLIYMVLQTKPVRPYADGAWQAGDVVALLAIGLFAGLIGRGAAGLAGIVLGMAGAVGVQLFVLTGQAAWIPEVAANLDRSIWAATVGAALGLGLASMLGGYAVVRAGLRVRKTLQGGVANRRAPGSVGAFPALGSLLAPLATCAGAGLLVGALILNAAGSAYVPAGSQPRITVEVRGDQIVSIEPATAPAGRVQITIVGRDVANADVILTGVLRPDQTGALDGGWLPYGQLRATLLGNAYLQRASSGAPGSGTRTHQEDLASPGVYAVVLSRIYTSWRPPSSNWDGLVPILSARTITVTAAAPGSVLTRGDNGLVPKVGLGFASLLLGWAASRTLAARGSSRARDLALIVAFVAPVLLAALALFAVDLAHNPF